MPARSTDTAEAHAIDGFYRRLSRAVVGTYVLIALAICAAAGWYAWQTRSERIASAAAQSTTLSRALDEHVRRALNAVDVVLSVIAADVIAAGGAEKIPERALHEALKRKLALVPQANSMFVYRHDLMIHAGSGFYPIPRVDGSKFSHVNVHLDAASNTLHVGRPLMSPVAKRWTIPVTRRMAAPDGRFLGVVGAIIDQNHFAAFYRELGLAPGQGLALIRSEGELLFVFPELANAGPGTDMRAMSPLFRQPRPLTAPVTLRFVSRLDGVERYVTFRENSELGLVVAVSHQVDALLAGWRRDTLRIAAGVIGTLAGLTVLMWVALAQIRRRAASERAYSETLERKVRERTAELQAANEELEAFSYSVSHDLRSPLNIVGGYVDLLRIKYANALPPESIGMLDQVKGTVRQMARLIGDLLELSGSSRQSLSRSRVDLSALAQSVADDLRAEAPARAVQVQIAPELAAHADPGLTRILLQNLLSNAWKYSSRAAQPRIEVGVETAGEERVFYVRDNGAGFDMKNADRLFRPFQRLHGSQEYSGSGVGLATVARIVQRHGGRVWADSAPGQGATFRFTLPQAGGDDAAAPGGR